MNKLLVYSLVLLYFILLSSCNDKIAIYSGLTLTPEGDVIKDAQATVIRNGKKLETKPEVLTIEDVKKVNDGEMIKRIMSDSSGKINIAFEDASFFKPDEIYLLVSKPGYDTSKIEIKWEIVLDDTIVLNPVRN